MATDGGAAFRAKLQKVMPTIEAEVSTKYRELVRRIFTDLVVNSPQWSGNLASNWTIGSGSYRELPGRVSATGDWYREDPYVMGDDPAVASVLLREIPKLANYTYKMPIRLSNATPYASEVEAGTAPPGHEIREENKLAEYGAVAMIGYVDMKYKALKGSKI